MPGPAFAYRMYSQSHPAPQQPDPRLEWPRCEVCGYRKEPGISDDGPCGDSVIAEAADRLLAEVKPPPPR